jgi:chorismate lyase/3-hydroxybenzoate synthase
LLLYFLAASKPGMPIENPRQVSAFRYPKVYAPRHPLFSRAMLKQWDAGTHLYISGTASVVGHRTCHVGDTLEQLRETARNLEAIVSRTHELQPLALKSAAQLSLAKVYVRRAEDLFRIQSEFDRLFSPALPRTYLLADICRSDLLLEIDAFYCEPTAS